MNGIYPLLSNQSFPSQQILPNGKTLNSHPGRSHASSSIEPDVFSRPPIGSPGFNNPLTTSNSSIFTNGHHLPTTTGNLLVNQKMNGGMKNSFLSCLTSLEGGCCLPGGCVRAYEDPVFSQDGVKEGVKEGIMMGCDNPLCQESRWMHPDCFREWQNRQNFLKLPRRTRHFSDQNAMSWMKRDFDHESKVNACRCGKGCLRQETTTNNDYSLLGSLITPPHNIDQWERRFNFMSPSLASSASPLLTSTSNSAVSFCHQLLNNNNNNNRLSSSPFNSTANNFYQQDSNNVLQLQQIFSNMHQQHFNSNLASSIRKQRGSTSSASSASKNFDFFPDKLKASAGNIFSRRGDMTDFDGLPRSSRNSYCVRVEDEGPYGNDETRCFILTSLSSSNTTTVKCVVCRSDLTVYDKYPLINGTFFLSPGSYDDCGIDVTNHNRRTYIHTYNNNNNNHHHHHHHQQFLNAVCMECSNGTRTRLSCLNCGRTWRGCSLVVGTMYNFDVFAATTCCSARLACLRCGRPVREYPVTPAFVSTASGVCQPASTSSPSFSEFCRQQICPRCHFEAFHAVKSLVSVFSINHQAN